MKTHSIPMEVTLAASELIQMFGPNLKYAGRHGGRDVYQFVMPEDQETGFPYIFLHKDGSADVKTMTGPEAMRLLASIYVE